MAERPQVLILQHVAVEGPGLLLEVLEAAGARTHTVRADRGMPVPRALAGYAGLVVMGGPMGVYETDAHPHLRDELALIEDALRQSAPIIGICLGSQLLAAALGARVEPGLHKEIGWFDVHVSGAGRADPAFAACPAVFRPLHWHGDVFELPPGAVSLARSELTTHQAFRAGPNALGLLFHLEAQAGQVSAMAQVFADELASARVDGGALVVASDESAARIEPVAKQVFGHWASALF
jgi:GMP synthase (glutamine-hydrolysing)